MTVIIRELVELNSKLPLVDIGQCPGIDEAGRGPLAGPVVAACVLLKNGEKVEGIKDSKKLSAKRRQELFEEIQAKYHFGVGIIEPTTIDKINILEATKLACIRAYEQLNIKAEYILVDGNMQFAEPNYISIIKGDDKVEQIAAASIIAKVSRDRIMQELALQHPQYSWDTNMGYGSKKHLMAIKEHGLTPHHRRSFRH